MMNCIKLKWVKFFFIVYEFLPNNIQEASLSQFVCKIPTQCSEYQTKLLTFKIKFDVKLRGLINIAWHSYFVEADVELFERFDHLDGLADHLGIIWNGDPIVF